MMADKSRLAILVCALLSVRTIALATPTALAANAESAPLHTGPWPIHNGRNYQPTGAELRALHLQDVTPEQARETCLCHLVFGVATRCGAIVIAVTPRTTQAKPIHAVADRDSPRKATLSATPIGTRR